MKYSPIPKKNATGFVAVKFAKFEQFYSKLTNIYVSK
jgi:hypothetical protein